MLSPGAAKLYALRFAEGMSSHEARVLVAQYREAYPETQEAFDNSQRKTSMNLNKNNFAELFRSDYYTVEVWFIESAHTYERQVSQQSVNRAQPKKYTYKVLKTEELKVGDKVVVCVSNDMDVAEELKICQVVSINNEPQIDGESSFKYKWIVGKFENVIADYRANVEKDTKLKRAVTKLEGALEKVALRTQLKLAMETLDDETKKELAEAFGMPNLLEDMKDCSNLEHASTDAEGK